MILCLTVKIILNYCSKCHVHAVAPLLKVSVLRQPNHTLVKTTSFSLKFIWCATQLQLKTNLPFKTTLYLLSPIGGFKSLGAAVRDLGHVTAVDVSKCMEW